MPQNKTKFGGFQNYLNRQDRSGLDPVDTYRTQTGIEGYFLRRLFTLKLRTRNIFSLIFMLLSGVGVTGFMGIALYAMLTTPLARKLDLIGFLMFAVLDSMFGLVLFIGIALLLNFGINLGIVLGIIKTRSINQLSHKTKKAKKKMPKRRKDFK